MPLIFASKYQAYGNDYFVLGSDQVPESEWPALTRDLCEPHFGLGADGCVFVSISWEGPTGFRIFNPDGTEAGMSGNGSRCAAAFLHHKRIVPLPEAELATRSGLRVLTQVEQSEAFWSYRAALGKPGFHSSEIPFVGANPDAPVAGFELEAGGRVVSIDALSVGNPQCVVRCDPLPSDPDFQALGSALAVHPAFPEGTNVSFARVAGPGQIEIRIWERGVGATHSSGTGCCGAAVAMLRAGLVESPVEVVTETGSQLVEWDGAGEIFLTGEVRFVADVHYQWTNG